MQRTRTRTTRVGPEVLRPDQIRQLLETPDRRTHRGRRDAALLGIMALAGLRVAEACRLTRDNVEEDNGMIRLVFRGKGQRLRTVTLPPFGAVLLRSWLRDPRAHPLWIFPGRRNEHFSVRAAQEVVRAVGREAGMPAWLHAHSLRHSFASAVMRQTGNLFLTQQVLGHASPTTTSRYYLAFSSRDADAAAQALDRVLHPRRKVR